MKTKELENIIGGGLSLTGALVTAIKGYVNTLYGIGQAFGGAIRRIATGNVCKF